VLFQVYGASIPFLLGGSFMLVLATVAVVMMPRGILPRGTITQQ